MSTPAIRIEHRQHQTVTPRLQQAVRLLQLSSLDFAQEVQNALGNNPFLEADETAEEPTEAAETGAVALANEQPLPVDAAPAGEASAETYSDAEAYADTAWERDSWQQAGTGSSSNR